MISEMPQNDHGECSLQFSSEEPEEKDSHIINDGNGELSEPSLTAGIAVPSLFCHTTMQSFVDHCCFNIIAN